MKTWIFFQEGRKFGPQKIERTYVESTNNLLVLDVSIGEKFSLSGNREGVVFEIIESNSSIGVTLMMYIWGEGLIELPL